MARQAVNDALAGNLCRCTGYRPIMDAALAVCAAEPRDAFTADKAVRALHVEAMANDGRDVMVGGAERFFAAPASEDALAALYAENPDATLVAGCTDVGLWVTKGMVELDRVIWLGRIPELASIASDGQALSLARPLPTRRPARRSRPSIRTSAKSCAASARRRCARPSNT